MIAFITLWAEILAGMVGLFLGVILLFAFVAITLIWPIGLIEKKFGGSIGGFFFWVLYVLAWFSAIGAALTILFNK